MSIPTALKARREALRNREDGFTLIELLVVVIIIGILAAIAIPIYLNVTNNAKISALQSDLSNAKTATVAYYTNNSSAGMPAIATDLKPWGYTQGSYSTPGVAPAYATGSTTTLFCIAGTSNGGAQYYITSNGPATAGTCPASSAW